MTIDRAPSILALPDTASPEITSGTSMRYPGGKGGAGVHQRLINLMPPHHTYIEPFVGGGNIYLRKSPAPCSIIIDADAGQIKKLQKHLRPGTIAIHGDASEWLSQRQWQGNEFIYCDPPYVMSSRSGRRIYKHEMTDEQHLELLSVLLTIPAAVMISGYKNQIYDDTLAAWERIDFQSMTRGGLRTESLWLNYQIPAVPAELTFLGDNFRERERIKRKKARWAQKLAGLPRAEQLAIMEILQQITSPL